MDQVTPEIRDAIRRVVAYNWADEQRDFEEQDDAGRRNHIFTDLTKLRSYFGATEDGCTCGSPDDPTMPRGPIGQCPVHDTLHA